MASPNSDPRATSRTDQISRYPGVQPFGDDEIQRCLFKGREEEKYELLQLVLAERLVTLFARSGIGKSSLINAGLLEPLRDRGYFPMVVRVSGSAGSPLDCLYDGIKAATNKAKEHGQIEYEPVASEFNRTSLWRFFKTFELWQGDKLLSPVLVIDQFEELFALYTVEQRKQFIHELADLVRGTRPRDNLDDVGLKLSDAPPEVKVVLALREDFYANLEELRDRIPSIYKAPFRLKPLSREQAKHALVEPAELEGEHFATPAFSWSDEALGKVLDLLSEQQLGEGKKKVGKEVEPFQLQLICQHVEEMVGARNLKTVQPGDLGGAEALKAVLSGFYEDSLQKICNQFPAEQDLRERLERLCEYGFITSKGRRLLREESTIKQDDGVGPEILREMVELRLLRKEPRVGDNYYELTHDTLIEPIQLSRQIREECKAREAWEKRHAEQQKMRNRLFAVGVGAALLLAMSGAMTLWQRTETQRVAAEKQQAEQEAQRALEAKNRALEAKKRALAAEQKSFKVAAKAQREAGAEEAKRLVAEAKTKVAEIEPEAVAAQKKLAEAVQQAVEAKGKDYEKEAKRLVAEGEAQLEKARQKVQKAQVVVYDAKTRATLAEVTDVKQAAAEIERQVEDKRTEQKMIEAEVLLGETERKSQNLQERLTSYPSSAAQPPAPPNVTAKKPDVEEKTEQQTRAKVELAALEFRETGPKITDAELAKQYREFLNSRGSSALSAEEVYDLENKIREFDQAAEEFLELERKDKDPNFSVCEAFDQWTAFQPRRALGPEAQYRDLRLAELNASLQDSAIVTTQENFITSGGRNDFELKDRFILTKDRVFTHVWVTSPRREALKLTLRRGGDTNESVWKGKKVEKNPLRGVRTGYHLWTWRNANTPGELELLLYNEKNRLICRRDFEIVAASE